eukprot:CAMPEP_0178698380 /NCGR_PEP_ID=MMETSP0699-20121125/10499_1 /TAXON_ID=265572 /ORGANISM="Extubocellulus spinifer, Strain CCMP396" /LENGTH=285 /DNA_ID=CAMNT_0020344423 /DNA_START=148 /DNA_END=1005 /DNA_ORIENTATION=+
MAEESAAAAAAATGDGGNGGNGGGGLMSGIVDQIIDAHHQVYNLVSGALGPDGGSGGGDAAGGGAGYGGGIHQKEIDLTPDELEELANGGGGSYDDENMKSPLEGMAEQVMGDIFHGQVGPQTPLEHLDAFRSAIQWTEPLIVALLLFQLIMFVVTVYTIRRGNTASRFGLLVSIVVIVRCTERFNEYCGGRWEDLATQNYFDTNGIFVLLFVALPLLGDCVLMVIGFMREASALLVEVKSMELKQKQKKKKEEEQKQKQKQKEDSENRDGGGGGKRGKRSKKDD